MLKVHISDRISVALVHTNEPLLNQINRIRNKERVELTAHWHVEYQSQVPWENPWKRVLNEVFGNTALVKVGTMIFRVNREKGKWRINGVIEQRKMGWKIVGSWN